MAVAIIAKILLCASIQVSLAGGQQTTAEAVLQQARDQVMIMTNRLMTDATVISQAAEGNASRLLADFYNDVNRGIADAQHNASMIGNTFQTDISKRAEEVMARATAIYTKVERSLRDATVRVEQSIARILNSTEYEMSRAMKAMKAGGVGPAVDAATVKNKNPQ